jgi:hypothetical protein
MVIIARAWDGFVKVDLGYEPTIQRQVVYAINQLERMQRARKRENVLAPVSVHLSSDQ